MMRIKNFRLALVAVLVAAVGACDGSTIAGPSEPDEVIERPLTRTACMAGGEVAQRAGCPEETWSNTDDTVIQWEEDLSPRQKRPN
jgi:hypothetical protein